MPIVRLPDGTRARFPDSMSREDIQSVLDEQFAPKQQPQSKSIGLEDIGRQLALTGRYAVEGATALPTIVGDAANALVNLGTSAVNKVAGTDIPPLQSTSGAFRGVLDRIFPKPESLSERVASIGSQALSGAGIARLAASGAQAAGPAIQKGAQFLADQPAMQVAGATAGALATEGAQQGGISNPYALMGIGMLGGTTPGAAQGVAGRVAGTALQAARPFMGGGREIIAGKALNRMATNPEAAARNMELAEPILPGSQPTVGQVSRDPGLMAGETAVIRGMDTRNELGARQSEQNAVRMNEVNRMARDEPTFDSAKAKRDSTVDTYMTPAFKGKSPVGTSIAPIENAIAGILKSNKGVRKDVQDAITFAGDRLDALKKSGHDYTDPEVLYEFRKDLALARDGKYDSDKSNLSLARGELASLIKTVDKTIEAGAPGYADYLQLYAKRSIPLDQLKALQEVRRRTVLPVTDPTTNQAVLSNAKFQSVLSSNMDKGIKLRETLSQQQIEKLRVVAADLDRGSAATAATAKVPGSDSFRNLSVASVIGRLIGDNAAAMLNEKSAFKTVSRPLAWLYQMPDEQIQHLMVQAWLDPKLASQLMRQASLAEVESVAAELKRKAAQQIAAQSLYGAE